MANFTFVKSTRSMIKDFMSETDRQLIIYMNEIVNYINKIYKG